MMTVVTTVTLTPAGAAAVGPCHGYPGRAARGAAGAAAQPSRSGPTSRCNAQSSGTWHTRAHWEAWHQDETFRETRD